MKILSMSATFVLVLSISVAVAAQDKNSAKALAESRASLITATNEYKATSESLVALQEAELKKAFAQVAQLRQLFSEGLIAKNELEETGEALVSLQAKLAATKQQISNSDQIIAEVKASEELAKKEALAAKSNPRSLVRPVLMRYNGTTQWSVANLANIQGFFLSKFGRSLPVSTIGQSATHNRLGWDHRHAADVGLHPDSVEGRALISYLQSQGIPFLAFRSAVPGVSTGPHIHIGTPSHRLA